MTETAEKRPVGRPSEYNPDVCEQVLDLGYAGKSRTQIAAKLGVSRQTLANWEKAHPEFLDALKLAKELEQAWWEDQGQAGLTAERFNATAFIFQMKNRFRDDYRDRQEHVGANGGPIEYTRLSSEERRARIAELQAKMNGGDRS